jgi:hypothetical protein
VLLDDLVYVDTGDSSSRLNAEVAKFRTRVFASVSVEFPLTVLKLQGITNE